MVHQLKPERLQEEPKSVGGHAVEINLAAWKIIDDADFGLAAQRLIDRLDSRLKLLPLAAGWPSGRAPRLGWHELVDALVSRSAVHAQAAESASDD
ncbi:hypothetical protein [Glycomyces tritici]|uniref:Uncharacterized protein n=1 Tax=Glycomyces tritici TaxID=2665176 RepID=A0ABT7YRZ5_9ACTN|nr:hypothetical protein [Glycomyces tritici]MDN3241416.1 hypothetical protein [Glycomyces tritici]